MADAFRYNNFLIHHIPVPGTPIGSSPPIDSSHRQGRRGGNHQQRYPTRHLIWNSTMILQTAFYKLDWTLRVPTGFSDLFGVVHESPPITLKFLLSLFIPPWMSCSPFFCITTCPTSPKLEFPIQRWTARTLHIHSHPMFFKGDSRKCCYSIESGVFVLCLMFWVASDGRK